MVQISCVDTVVVDTDLIINLCESTTVPLKHFPQPSYIIYTDFKDLFLMCNRSY